MFPLFSLTLKALGLAVAILTLYFIFNEIVRYKNRLSGLKGPRGLPLIGSLREVNPCLLRFPLGCLHLILPHR
jgi:hypothetical protein